jgi:hypothetical protein
MVPVEGPFEMVHGSGDLTRAVREANWPTQHFDLAPGAACRHCNEGWMDRNDREAEQIVEPMVIGQKATIRQFIDQKTEARWVSQVAILIDQTQIIQVVPSAIACKFHADQEPLAGIVIWLAPHPARLGHRSLAFPFVCVSVYGRDERYEMSVCARDARPTSRLNRAAGSVAQQVQS